MQPNLKLKNKSFTKEKIESLKLAYSEANKRKADSFMFEGDELLTAFAKYMIEYLESK